MIHTKLQSIIKARRKELGLRQVDIGKKVSRGQNAYSYIENNLDKAPWTMIISILQALELQILIIPSEQLPMAPKAKKP